MWTDFTYQAAPMRVTFGPGRSQQLADEIDALGLGRALVLSTPDQEPLAQRIAAALGSRSAGVYPKARMHVPIETAHGARQAAQDRGADSCVAVGGGSTIGLGKAIALTHGLPIVAVPTTYAGSEMTPIWGLTEGGVKRTGRDQAVLPRSVVYDPELTLTLPIDLSVASAMNALAHAVEGLYAPDASPIVSLMATDGARAIVEALPRLAADGTDITARSRTLYGSWLCGAVLGATTMSLHHKLCHVLGGSFDLPHAQVHTIVLPHVAAFNAPASAGMRSALQEVLCADDPASALWELTRSLGAPTALADIGMQERDLPAVVDAVLREPYANPRSPNADDLRSLLTRAQRGQRPQP